MRTGARQLAVFAAVLVSACSLAPPSELTLNNDHRTQTQIDRDRYRHPAETLAFFEIRPDMTVVEIWPGGGWYSAVLAPLLRDRGKLYAAHFPSDSHVAFYTRSHRAYVEALAQQPEIYDRVTITELYPPDWPEAAPRESADAVLTFRNVHNWAKSGNSEQMFQAFYQALKPGGVLGVVEHRAPAGRSFEDQIESGYMTEDYVIQQALAAGFVLEAQSEINANPLDDRNHPAGVWTLPPTLRLGDTDQDKYRQIGESDRMTLRFIKPAGHRD